MGKTECARALLVRAQRGHDLVQWVDVDALWLHQPWRVDEATIGMLQSNLTAVLANAVRAGVDVVVVTWVFQEPRFHDLVVGLAPAGTEVLTIQLVVDEVEWRKRFKDDPDRPPIDAFYVERYRQAQATPADHRIEVTHSTAVEVAAAIARVAGLE